MPRPDPPKPFNPRIRSFGELRRYVKTLVDIRIDKVRK